MTAHVLSAPEVALEESRRCGLGDSRVPQLAPGAFPMRPVLRDSGAPGFMSGTRTGSSYRRQTTTALAARPLRCWPATRTTSTGSKDSMPRTISSRWIPVRTSERWRLDSWTGSPGSGSHVTSPPARPLLPSLHGAVSFTSCSERLGVGFVRPRALGSLARYLSSRWARQR